ncbi:MAG: PKD domain-containing protein, partial [Bacteroidota bacterium]
SFSSALQTDGSNFSVNRLVKWNGTQWETVGTFTNDQGFGAIESLTFGADATLYFGGNFETANGETVNDIARWNPNYGLAGFGKGMDHRIITSGVINQITVVDSFLYVLGKQRTAGLFQSSRISRYLLNDNPAAGQIAVDLGPDTTACSTINLDAGNNGANFVWNTGDQGQLLTVSQTGWYAVTVFDGNCSDQDSVFVTIVTPDPVFDQDTIAACNEVLIDAGPDYQSYSWNTGDTTQTTTVNDGSTITIMVVDSNGCGITDTIIANIIGYDPTAAFSDSLLQDSSFSFNAGASFDANTYSWDFGDGTQASGEMVTHAYASNDSFLVTLIVSNDCGSDTTTTIVVVDFLTSLEIPLALRQLKLYPNPAQDFVMIEANFAQVMPVELRLFDLQGREHFAQRLAPQSKSLRQKIELKEMPSGVYILQVQTPIGTVHHKLIKE